MIIKNIFFDFDGVLVDSVDIKTEAFRKMYLPYGKEIADKVVKHHHEHGGVSRYEKFKIYHNDFLEEEINEAKVQELANLFSKLVLTGVIEAPEVAGAYEFLEKNQNTFQSWIITGTPTNEILKITKARNLTNLFVGIHGSPQTKKYWVDHLLTTHNLKAEETIFLGDATTDYEAAQHGNLHFALRSMPDNEALFKNYTGLRFKDFYELEEQLTKSLAKN